MFSGFVLISKSCFLQTKLIGPTNFQSSLHKAMTIELDWLQWLNLVHLKPEIVVFKQTNLNKMTRKLRRRIIKIQLRHRHLRLFRKTLIL